MTTLEPEQSVGLGSVDAGIKQDPTVPANPIHPPPKTDKPRPHVCGTCQRSFARLEHLKRHERSHTKEKPFECPQCTRCFARRDLLLRHQQKLHQTGAPSSRSKHGRRGSMAVANPATGKIRKNSVVGDMVSPHIELGMNGIRPRANTISHIGGPGMLPFYPSGMPRLNGGSLHSHHASLNGFSPADHMMGHMAGFQLPNVPKFDQYTQLNGQPPSAMHSIQHRLVNGHHRSLSVNTLDHPTINPAHLHFDALAGSPGPLEETFGQWSAAIEDDDQFDWTGGLGDSLLVSNISADAGMNGSSPSAISTGSHGGMSESFMDQTPGLQQHETSPWSTGTGAAPPLVSTSAFSVDPITAALYHELVTDNDTASPQLLQNQQNNGAVNFDMSYSASMESSITLSPDASQYTTHLPMSFHHETSTGIFGGQQWSQYPAVQSPPNNCTISEATRQTLLSGLSQPSGFGHTSRRYSQNDLSSPLSPNPLSPDPFGLPSTADLQRFVDAYIKTFHRHLPFLHICSLNFNQPERQQGVHSPHGGPQQAHFSARSTSKEGCLILAMAAVGACAEYEFAMGRELFESSKKMIGQFLEQRRSQSHNHNARQQTTPVWLVQAMLLNLIYGHCCGDKVTADIATTHSAALVSLAKAAQLDQSDPELEPELQRLWEESRNNGWVTTEHSPEPDVVTWTRWKSDEGRRRTLFAVFVLSSMLVSAYNDPPRIMNSEIHMILPCEEDLWAAESPAAWLALGGAANANLTAISFADALTYLLTASQRQHTDNLGNNIPQAAASRSVLSPSGRVSSDLNASAFGCYILINALHVYIWETRQRHQTTLWNTKDISHMHDSIAPALRAWQAAWEANPKHRLDWPSPSGPLPADCIPLLDLAYIRLFVNLGRVKEAFWSRDFVAMAQELASGPDLIQQGGNMSRDGSPGLSSYGSNSGGTTDSSPSDGMFIDMMNGNEYIGNNTSSNNNNNKGSSLRPTQISSREKHLRKAAFYAADSLSMADKLGLASLEFSSRSLPIQAALCQFDCAQVLAEWVTTVQERVGRYLGILGRDDVNLSREAGVSMLLEEEDVKLLQKIGDVLEGSLLRLRQEGVHDGAGVGLNGEMTTDGKALEGLSSGGFGGRLLRTTAFRLAKAAVWPVANVMAQALLVHAEFMDQRASASLPS